MFDSSDARYLRVVKEKDTLLRNLCAMRLEFAHLSHGVMTDSFPRPMPMVPLENGFRQNGSVAHSNNTLHFSAPSSVSSSNGGMLCGTIVD